jgi:hypothetical protein
LGEKSFSLKAETKTSSRQSENDTNASVLKTRERHHTTEESDEFFRILKRNNNNRERGCVFLGTKQREGGKADLFCFFSHKRENAKKIFCYFFSFRQTNPKKKKIERSTKIGVYINTYSI